MAKRGRKGILSSVIDPLLFEGGRKVSEIGELLAGQFGDRFDKKLIINNIRSRMVVLQSRGFRLEKDHARKVIFLSKTQVGKVDLNEATSNGKTPNELAAIR